MQDPLDKSYNPSDELYGSSTSLITESEESDNDKDEELERHNSYDPILDSKATVFLSCPLPLLRICQMCFSRASKTTKFMSRGSNLIVTRKSSKGHISEWTSHPKIKGCMSGESYQAHQQYYLQRIHTLGLKNLWKLLTDISL